MDLSQSRLPNEILFSHIVLAQITLRLTTTDAAVTSFNKHEAKQYVPDASICLLISENFNFLYALTV